MSFLKKLFESKKKDKQKEQHQQQQQQLQKKDDSSKYGKGYRLGDAAESAAAAAQRMNQMSETAPPAISLRSNNEAALRAAEAAMQRLQLGGKTTATTTTTTMSPRVSSAKSAQNEMTEEEKELKRALELKEHYFGRPKLVDAVPIIKKSRIWYKSDVLGDDQRYPKEEIENRIEQFLLDQIDKDPILASVTLLLTANYKQADKLAKCKETLTKIADNIMNQPSEEKYRRIRIQNKVFAENVYALKYAQLVLSSAGFEAKQIAVKEDEPDVKEDFYVFEAGTDLEKLEYLKKSLELAEPVLPQLDRDIKIFKPESVKSKANCNIRDEYEMDDFYNLKVEDMLKEQQLRNEALEKQGMLRTKAMRERDEQLELRRYNFCLVRVKFPNDYTLEALFRTHETLADLYGLVQENLHDDFHLPFELVGPSLKKTTSGPGATLAEAGLAPASLLYFKLIGIDSNAVNIKHYLKLH